jgi:hypothetical protein
MIVCSLPRCGATRFCLNLQEQTGLEFVGEFNPYFIQELGLTNVKTDTHETKYQPTYSINKFTSLLHNHNNHILLVNDSPHLVIDKADYVVLRHNMKNAFLSTSNYLIVMFPNIKANIIIHMLDQFYRSYVAVKGYTDKYSREVVWYEDYYGLTSTQTPELDKYIHRKVIVNHISEMFDA